MPCATFELDGNGVVRRVLARSELFTVVSPDGINPDGLCGRSVSELLPADSAPQVLRALAEAADKGIVSSLRLTVPTERGPRTLAVSISAIQHTPDNVPRFVILLNDITDQLQDQARMEIALSVFDHTEEGIVVIDAGGRLIECNAAFSALSGFSREDVREQKLSLSQVCSQRARSMFQNMWAALMVKGSWQGELRSLRKNGEQYWSSVKLAAVRQENGEITHYVGVLGDITALKDQQKALEHASQHDALTGLPNRLLMADRLQQAIARTKRHGKHLAVVYIDLDGFKAINDTHGHSAGDHLLITVSQRMKAALRESDTVARLGGDEFAVVLTDLAEAHDHLPVIERLLAAAADPVIAQDKVLRVSASIGVTLYPQADADDADQLMRQADQAMYQAKLAGKNRYHQYDAERDRAIRSHHEMIEAIRRALRNGEFVLYYQPKVNMRSGEVIGAEALIRWQHPEEGLLAPGRFLPFVENHPLSIDIGEWVIATALRQLEEWQALGLNLSVSVNVGAMQLQHPDFAARLQALLAMHPTVPADCIEVEVLETSALADVAHTSQAMRACAQFGVRFALDDFGTGYSSLMYLKQLPISTIKIDQGFVRHMLEDTDNLPILEGVLTLARGFGRHPIAEGVETVAHGVLLLQMGCELGQGYGIARPMPAEDFPAWAGQWMPDIAWSSSGPVNHDDLSRLVATTELDAWVRAIVAHLNGQRDAPAAPELQATRMERWLSGDGARLYGGSPAFSAIRRLHRQCHALGHELLTQYAAGEHEAARARGRELEAMVAQINDQFGGLMRVDLHYVEDEQLMEFGGAAFGR